MQGNAQTKVTINHKVQRFIGDVSTLDRSKFFNLHAKSHDKDVTAFYEEYNIGEGRGFWGPMSESKRKGFTVGSTYPNSTIIDKSTDVKEVNRYVGTEHPRTVFVDEMDVEKAANWAAKYFVDEVDADDRPEFYEPMNEPFVHAHDFYEGKWITEDEIRVKRRMAELFGAIGKKIHDTPSLGKMKVVGYSSAWPSLEINNFAHWEDNMKMFMDVAGDDMDAFATHLYDGVNITGQNNNRSGSNSEAILDLIETYSYKKWGKVKPHAITEYGVITSGFDENYTDLESIQSIKGINHMLFNLLDRENVIDISIPFITDKSTWHLTENNGYQPYGAALFIPTNIGEKEVQGWRYSPKIHFFELWKNVQGKRIQIASDNPDIQSQAFLEDKILFIALNNLDIKTQTVNLDFIESLEEIDYITKKSLRIYNDKQEEMSNEKLDKNITSLELVSGETVVLEYHFTQNIELTSAIAERKYYAPEHITEIKANTQNTFTFNGLVTDQIENVTLHMGIGRKHDKSKKPIILVNNTSVDVPTNWKGSDQAHRDDFFGVIEIPIDANLIKANNTITVSFPDDGGHISSMILEVSNQRDVSLGLEKVQIISPNTSVGSAQRINVDLKYTATTSRDLVAEFWSQSQWLGQFTTTVPAGIGTQTLSIPLGSTPTIGDKYIVKASLRPVGKSWEYNIATDQKNDILAVEEQGYTVNFIIKNNNNELIEGTNVSFNEQTVSTNGNGEATFNNIFAGTYNYSLSHDQYNSYSEDLIVSNENVMVEITLDDKYWIHAGEPKTVTSGDLVTLTASTSDHTNVTYKWFSSADIDIENSENKSMNFVAPNVADNTEILIELEGTINDFIAYDNIIISVLPNNDITSSELITDKTSLLYPNPVEDIININLKDDTEIVFMTSSGKEVKTVSLTKGDQAVNVADLQKGFYFLSVSNNDITTLHKIIKK
nr:agarase GM001950 [Flammeovirga pacifica]